MKILTTIAKTTVVILAIGTGLIAGTMLGMNVISEMVEEDKITFTKEQ